MLHAKTKIEEKPELPQGYYLEHFTFILRFISEQQYQILSKDEQETLDSYFTLPLDAQMLFVRLFNRKPLVFKLPSLHYPEISDIPQAAECLVREGFASREMLPHLLSDFLRQEKIATLRTLVKDLSLEIPANTSKPQLAELIAQQAEVKQVEAYLNFDSILSLLRREHFEFYLFLFFGGLRYDLTAFVLRDLKQRRLHTSTANELTPRFKNREEALETHRYARLKQEIGSAPEEQLESSALQLRELPRPKAALAKGKFDSACLKLAKKLEQRKNLELSLSLYQRVDSPPSRERQVRLLMKLERQDRAYELLEEIAKEPLCAEERLFAEDYLRKRKQPKLPRQIRKAKRLGLTLELSKSWRKKPEAGVIADYASRGISAFHTENRVWRTLFALLFWDLLFDLQRNSFHTPFQQLPLEFRQGTLFKKREKEVGKILDILRDETLFFNTIQERYLKHYRTQNPFVTWSPEILSHIAEMYKRLSPASLSAVVEEMTRNPAYNVSGFPDLLVFEGEDAYFLEVKSPQDQLSAQQLHWLQFFDSQGIRADLLQIQWKSQ